RNRAVRALRSAEQEAGEGVAGLSLRREAWQFRLLRVEVEVAGAGLVADIQVVLPQLETGFIIMSPADEGEIVHQDGAPVEGSAPIPRAEPASRADAAALRSSATEDERREMCAGDVLQADLLGPVLIHVNALVSIAEAVVAERDVIQKIRAD